MLRQEEIKHMIEEALPGSTVVISDPRHDGVHLAAHVIYSGFRGKSLLEQHRMVYAVLEEALASDEVHALSLKTEVGE